MTNDTDTIRTFPADAATTARQAIRMAKEFARQGASDAAVSATEFAFDTDKAAALDELVNG